VCKAKPNTMFGEHYFIESQLRLYNLELKEVAIGNSLCIMSRSKSRGDYQPLIC